MADESGLFGGPSFDIKEIVGWPAEDAAERCRRDGLDVLALDADERTITADFGTGRVRLWVRDGKVLRAMHG